MFWKVATEEEIKSEGAKKKIDIESFLDSFIRGGNMFVEAIDDEHHYNNNNDFCRALNCFIKSGNYKLYVTAFMKNGKVYLKRVDI